MQRPHLRSLPLFLLELLFFCFSNNSNQPLLPSFVTTERKMNSFGVKD